MIDVTGLGYRDIVRDASLALRRGELVALLGPNGAGKTTLLRLILGLLVPDSGEASLASLHAAERARRVAYLPQTRPLAWPARVRDIAALGRFAHGGALGRLGEADAAAVDRALVACDLTLFAERRADTLSGGELARVHLARAFAGETPLIVADEPVAALDPRHQHQVLGLFRKFVEKGGGALIVLHDLALAARYAERLIWMNEGRIVAEGTPAETMTPERIAEIYGVRARLVDGEPVIDGLA